MKQKYIKFFGTNGTGKTTMVRELSKVMTGTQCDNWKNVDNPPIISYNICDCGEFSAIGKWKPNNKVNGMDTMRSDKYQTYQESKKKNTFNFKNKILEDKLNIKSKVIFEEGLVTASVGIHEALNSKYELYTFLMDYPLEFCVNNYNKRGSLIQDDITIEKMKGKLESSRVAFEKLKIQNKFKLSGTVEENISKVIKISDLKPCLCMKDYQNKKLSRSLFGD